LTNKWKNSLLFERIFTLIISVILVMISFVIIFLSGSPFMSMYQGMSLIFFILIIITLLMIYIRVSEIKIKEVRK